MKSFTLIEILVVTTILLLFSGVILANYNSFNQKKNLEKEASKLMDILSLAKSKAQKADLLPALDCSGSDEFGGYRVELNESSYSFMQCCRDTTTKNATICSSPLNTYDFPAYISKVSGLDMVDFYPLAEGATPTTIRLNNAQIDKCIDLDISGTGIVSATEVPCS